MRLDSPTVLLDNKIAINLGNKSYLYDNSIIPNLMMDNNVIYSNTIGHFLRKARVTVWYEFYNGKKDIFFPQMFDIVYSNGDHSIRELVGIYLNDNFRFRIEYHSRTIQDLKHSYLESWEVSFENLKARRAVVRNIDKDPYLEELMRQHIMKYGSHQKMIDKINQDIKEAFGYNSWEEYLIWAKSQK